MANAELTSMSLEVSSLEGLELAANSLIKFAKGDKIWVMDGEMGAGKTTFVKAICEQLGVGDNVNSPTFSIVNEYRDESEGVYYHFDFYRIKNEEEAMDIGVDEYFYSGNHCFIEWASLIPSLLPDTYLKIEMQILDRERRLIKCTRHG
jgi:tRNA threonylcarbamoyladenosine biosynthesis protein TsaE